MSGQISDKDRPHIFSTQDVIVTPLNILHFTTMAKSLVIVESPTKAKTLSKYLGRNDQMMASVGHLKDLPKSKLVIDLEHNFDGSVEKIDL